VLPWQHKPAAHPATHRAFCHAASNNLTVPFGEIFLLGSRQLRRQEVEEDRKLLPPSVDRRHDGRQEVVGSAEDLGFALEVDLLILVERGCVDHDAGIKDRVELVTVGTAIGVTVSAKPSISIF
jgi:hypothetical protein